MSTSSASGADRRAVLRGAAVVGVTGSVVGPLAACGGSSNSGSPSTGAPTVPDGGKPTGDIVKASEVPVGGGKVVNASGTKVVVTQPQVGVYKAFSAICTHKGCTVNSIEDDVIRCPCHGSEYDGSTGAVVKQAPGVPAGTQAPLAAIPVAVSDGSVSFA